MRLSELYKFKEFQKNKGSEPQKPKESAYAKPPPPETLKPAQEPAPQIDLDAADARPQEIYSDLIRLTRGLLSGLARQPVRMPDLEAICEVMDKVIEALERNPFPLLELSGRSTLEDYLPGHIANVTLLSLFLAQELQWSKEVRRAVGVGAFLHDAGMGFLRPPYNDSRLPSFEENKRTAPLSQECLKILNDFLSSLAAPSKTIIETIVMQTQERISGKGHPKGLQGDQISKEAQLVGICDAFEALSHPRPYQGARIPHDALRHMIGLSGESFDSQLIKKLWESLTLFPPGSFIRLNTGETAKILRINKSVPTRPLVAVIASAGGQRVDGEKILDLSRAPDIVIEKALDECSLKLEDPRLALELRAQKWWVS